MKLSIFSLKKVLFQGNVESLSCKTVVGEITVLDHHRPLIGVLTEGTMRIKDEKDKERYFPIKNGFLEVRSDNSVRALVSD
jgi:F-type H+-transporting ATPase subunit epsilon